MLQQSSSKGQPSLHRRIGLSPLATALLIMTVSGCASQQNPPDATQPTVVDNKTRYAAPPPATIDVSKTSTAEVFTNKGVIVLDLFPKEAPLTVNNFVFLAREKFFDGDIFHRVIADFMIQSGDPTGTGHGDPGYLFQDETDPRTNPHEFNTAGTLAMANHGPNTNGCQFFITHLPTPKLQGHYTIFGHVHDDNSQDVVNAIRKGDVITHIQIDEK